MAPSELGQPLPVENTSWDAKRIISRSNSDANSTPGMTVFVTPEVADHIRERSREVGYAVPEVSEVIDGVVSLEYPRGLFLTGHLGVDLYERTDTPMGDKHTIWNGRKNPLSYSYSRIIRIEGKGGEVWQNFNYANLGERIQSARPQRPPAPNH